MRKRTRVRQDRDQSNAKDPGSSPSGARSTDPPLDFFEIMRRVIPWLDIGSREMSWRELQIRIDDSFKSMIAKAKKSGPVPPRLLERIESLHRSVADSIAFLAHQAPIAFERWPIVHPVLVILIEANFEHLQSTFSRDVAERAFTDVLRSLTRRRKGTPTKIPLAVVQKAKQLHDSGKSWAEVGRKLGFTGPQVRTAVQYHFQTRKQMH
jgi:hypothetical protein